MFHARKGLHPPVFNDRTFSQIDYLQAKQTRLKENLLLQRQFFAVHLCGGCLPVLATGCIEGGELKTLAYYQFAGCHAAYS